MPIPTLPALVILTFSELSTVNENPSPLAAPPGSDLKVILPAVSAVMSPYAD